MRKPPSIRPDNFSRVAYAARVISVKVTNGYRAMVGPVCDQFLFKLTVFLIRYVKKSHTFVKCTQAINVCSGMKLWKWKVCF